jgi:outer membrane immunogenic protein
MEQGAMRRSQLITLVILCFLSSARAKADDIAYAYCPLGEGYVFLYDTVTGFNVLVNLQCGEKLTVVDTHDKERTKVRTAKGKEGYVFKYTITPVFGVPPESAAVLDVKRPDVTLPDVTRPDVTLPDVALPDVSIKPSQPAPEAHPEAPPQAQPPPEPQPSPEPQAQSPPEPQPAQEQRPAQPLAESRRTQPVLRRPREFEVFGGYSYMRSNIALSSAPLGLNGGSASMVVYINDRLGIVGDFGLYRQNNVAGQGFNLLFSTYQFGPRLRFSNATRATPFVHFLWGAGHAGGTLYTRSLGYGVPPLGANYTFVLTAGGGADWRVSSRISIRMIEAEYMHSEFLNFSGNRQENIRLSAGVVFNFGGE